MIDQHMMRGLEEMSQQLTLEEALKQFRAFRKRHRYGSLARLLTAHPELEPLLEALIARNPGLPAEDERACEGLAGYPVRVTG